MPLVASKTRVISQRRAAQQQEDVPRELAKAVGVRQRGGNATLRHLAANILTEAVKRGVGEKFVLRDVVPGKEAIHDAALRQLLTQKYVEEVRVSCGKWHYRLTELGRTTGVAGALPLVRPRPE